MAKWDSTGESVRRWARRNQAGVVQPTNLPTPPHNTLTPRITGSNKIGSTLEAIPGTWEGNPPPSVNGQWYKDGHAIIGATGLKYTLIVQDAFADMSYREDATNPSGAATSASNVIQVEAVDIGGITFDNYANGFGRGYWNQASHARVPLLSGGQVYLEPLLATRANPGGVTVPDTAALAAIGGTAWFDNNGTLGKFKVESTGADIPIADMAAAIEAKAILRVRYVDPDVLVYEAVPPEPILLSGFSNGFSNGFGS